MFTTYSIVRDITHTLMERAPRSMDMDIVLQTMKDIQVWAGL